MARIIHVFLVCSLLFSSVHATVNKLGAVEYACYILCPQESDRDLLYKLGFDCINDCPAGRKRAINDNDFCDPCIPNPCGVNGECNPISAESGEFSCKCRRGCSGFLCNQCADDRTPPVIIDCPTSPIRVTARPGDNAATVTWIEPTIDHDPGVTPTLTSSHSRDSLFQVGTTTVTYTSVDGSGNQAICQFQVIVEDGVPGGIVVSDCPMNINIMARQGTSLYQGVWDEPSAVDIRNGGIITVTTSHRSPWVFDVPSMNMITYTFTNQAGEQVQCMFTISVSIDDSPPVLSCPGDISSNIAPNAGSVNVQFTEPTATDNSGQVSLVYRSHGSGELFSRGTTTVIYTFQDGPGNTASCSFNIIVSDSQTPTCECDGDIMRTIPPVGGANVFFPACTATDGSFRFVSSTHTSGQRFSNGTTTVEYVFADSSNNIEICDFTITVMEVDTTRPVVKCPDDLSRTIQPGIGSINVQFTEATATDNSGRVSLVFRSHVPGNAFPVGTTPVTYTYEDPTRNRESCSFNIVVSENPFVDSTPPVITPVDDIRLSTPCDSDCAHYAYSEPHATDASGTVNLVSRTHMPGQCFQMGITTVTYQYGDASGNLASYSFNIIVKDGCITLTPEQIQMTNVNRDILIQDMGGMYRPEMLDDPDFYTRSVVPPLTPEQEATILARYPDLFVSTSEIENETRRRKRQAQHGNSRICEVLPPGQVITSLVTATDSSQSLAQIVYFNNFMQWTFHEYCAPSNPSSFPCKGAPYSNCIRRVRNTPALVYVIPLGGGVPQMTLRKTIRIFTCVPVI